MSSLKVSWSENYFKEAVEKVQKKDIGVNKTIVFNIQSEN